MQCRTERQKQIQKLEKEIQKLDSKRAGRSDSDSETERTKRKAKKSHLEEELAKYSKNRGVKGRKDEKGKRNESDVLSKLSAFRSKLKSSFLDEDDVQPTPGEDGADVGGDRGKEAAGADAEEAAMEVDTDTDFLSHKLFFPKDNNEEVEKAEREYEVIDPRQRSARAREEERERKKRTRPKDGGRGYRR